MEIAIENGRVPCNFTSDGDYKYAVKFHPARMGPHSIQVKFNGIEVTGNKTPFFTHNILINFLNKIFQTAHFCVRLSMYPK